MSLHKEPSASDLRGLICARRRCGARISVHGVLVVSERVVTTGASAGVIAIV